MNIQPIPYGKNKNAVSVLLEWSVKPFFAEVYNLNIQLLDEGNNLIDTIEKQVTPAKYVAYGTTKEEKATAILTELGFVVLPTPTII